MVAAQFPRSCSFAAGDTVLYQRPNSRWITEYGTRAPGSPVSCAVGERPTSRAQRTSSARIFFLVHRGLLSNRAKTAANASANDG
jgi:hypothetical protein